MEARGEGRRGREEEERERQRGRGEAEANVWRWWTGWRRKQWEEMRHSLLSKGDGGEREQNIPDKAAPQCRMLDRIKMEKVDEAAGAQIR